MIQKRNKLSTRNEIMNYNTEANSKRVIQENDERKLEEYFLEKINLHQLDEEINKRTKHGTNEEEMSE